MKIAEFPLKRISQQQRYAHQSIFLIFLVVLAIFLSAPLPTQAQTSSNASWRTFTTADGLAGNNVFAIYQDSERALWFGTDKGVSRYKSGRWQTFTTADGLTQYSVRAITEDSEGGLWFGTNGGVSRYQEGVWQSFTSADGWVGNNVRAITEDSEGALWFGTDGGVSRYYKGQWHTFTTADGLVDRPIQVITQDSEGTLWFVADSGVSLYQGGQWETFNTPDNLYYVKAFTKDSEGALWFGTYGSVRRYQGGQWQTFTTGDGLASIDVLAIYQESKGALWFGTGRGISRYQGGQWQTFTTANGLAGNDVRAISQDSEGALWFGTDGGVSRYHADHRQTFTTANGLAGNFVRAIYQDSEGGLWFGTDGGVSYYQSGQWEIFNTPDNLYYVQAIIQDNQGVLWFASAGRGISRYQDKEWQVLSANNLRIKNDTYYTICRDSEGALWFGTLSDGVIRYREGIWQSFTTANGLAGNLVQTIIQDNEGTLWFGTDGGVSRYQGEQWRTFTTADGMEYNSVLTIYQDSEGALWFGTDKGVSRYMHEQWQTFTTADGLANNEVWAIMQDNNGALWFGTYGGGVSRYQDGIWQTFTTGDGLAGNIVYVIVQDSVGALWFGTGGGGISRFWPGTIPPGVWLTSVDGQPYEENNQLNLSPNTDRLTVTFKGGDTATRTEDLIYVHRLIGVSEEWTTTNQQNAVYSDLSPGRYTFQVKALDRDGNFSEPAEVKIAVLPPPPTATPIVQQIPGPTRIIPGPTQIIPGPTQVVEVEPTVTLWGRSVPQTTLYGYGLAGLTTLAIATVGFNRWQKQRRTGQAIAHKENPYSANVPVKDPKMFFGREDILRQIVNGIHLNNFAVCGPKRIGKTSLLHQVAVALPKLEDAPNSLRPVMLSLHGVAEGYFFYHLARAIAQQTRAGLASPSLPGRADEGAFDEYQFLEELETTHAALQAASTKPLRLVLLIDEGDALNAYSQPTLAKLRYVLMGPGLELLKMVWSGEGLDQRPWALPGSDWLTVFGDVFYLTPLTEAEATRLIQDPVPYYDYDKEAIRLILEQSQLIPHRIQLLCRTAIEEMLKEGRGRIEVKDVEAAGHALTSLPYRVAAVTEAQGQLAESRSEYHTRPGDEATE